MQVTIRRPGIIITVAAALAMATHGAASIVINEVFKNPPGSDTSPFFKEWIELRSTTGGEESLADHYLLIIDGDSDQSGVIDSVVDLGALSTGTNGLLLVQEGDNSGNRPPPDPATPTFLIPDIAFENNSATFAIVIGFTGSQGDDLDTDNDGVIDVPVPWTAVADAVGMPENDGSPSNDFEFATELGGLGFPVPPWGSDDYDAFAVGTSGTRVAFDAVDGTAPDPTYFVDGGEQILDDGTQGSFTPAMLFLTPGSANPELVPPEPPEDPYSAIIHEGRFLNSTQLDLGGNVGDTIVDPGDGTTILAALDETPAAGGGIYRIVKTAPGVWQLDTTPVVGDLDRPSALAVDAAGNLWWVHDYEEALMRLAAPWDSNTAEAVIDDFGSPGDSDDDPISLCVAPAGFAGSIGSPGWLAVADRGADDDAYNAVYVVDPATAILNQVEYSEYLVPPTIIDLGAANLNDIEAIPGTGEVVTLSDDGFFFAVDANGSVREIIPTDLYFTTSETPNAAACAVDPTTGRLWIADDSLDQVWSVDTNPAAQSPDRLEISFFLEGELQPGGNVDFHDPSMAFAPDGSFLVVTDSDTRYGGGRLFIFHDDTVTPASYRITGISRLAHGIRVNWEDAGFGEYRVLRSTTPTAGFGDISGPLTTTSFTDDAPPADGAYYGVTGTP